MGTGLSGNRGLSGNGLSGNRAKWELQRLAAVAAVVCARTKVRRSHICAGTLTGAATEESRMLSGTGLSGNRAKRDRAKWEWYVRRCLGVHPLFSRILWSSSPCSGRLFSLLGSSSSLASCCRRIHLPLFTLRSSDTEVLTCGCTLRAGSIQYAESMVRSSAGPRATCEYDGTRTRSCGSLYLHARRSLCGPRVCK